MDLTREWAGVSVTVSTEKISEPVEWSSEHSDHLAIVNLGGVTSRLEARLGKGAHYIGAPTLGELSVIPAGERFGGVYQGTVVRTASILFRGASLMTEDVLSQRGSPIPFRPRLGTTDPFLFGCVYEISKLIGSDDAQSDLFCESIAHTLKLYMVRTHSVVPPVTPKVYGRGTGDVAKIQGFIAENIEKPLTLTTLAGVADIPVHHMITAFRAVLGSSPARYVLLQRIKRARWLLAHSTSNLADIAYSCGFSSQSHLTTSFRKEIGVTPAAFRAQYRSGGDEIAAGFAL